MSRGRRYAARFTFAHLARCAAAIRLRPAAEIVRFGLLSSSPIALSAPG